MSRESFRELMEKAKSGQISDLIAFMRAITKKIAEDKARQNVEMANKLLELEEQSRDVLQKLLDVPEPENEEDKRRVTLTINRLEGKIFSLAELLKKYKIRV